MKNMETLYREFMAESDIEKIRKIGFVKVIK